MPAPPSPSPTPASYGERQPIGRRLVSLAIALAINGLLLLMLLTLAPPPWQRTERSRPLLTFDMLPSEVPAPTPTRAPSKQKRAGGGAAARAPVPAPAAVPPTPPVEAPPPPLNMVVVSKEVYAAADITRLPTHAPAADAATDGEGQGRAQAGRAGDSAVASGTGPGGEKLYAAEWFREPTSAELNGYLKSPPPPGSTADVACHTIANNHVDRCMELGETPPGARIVRAMRLAAWQFLIRPPRVGGKPLVGEWVRIHITFAGRPPRDDGPRPMQDTEE